MTLLLLLASILVFLLVAFGATPGDLDHVRLVAVGLALFAGAHVGWPDNWQRR